MGHDEIVDYMANIEAVLEIEKPQEGSFKEMEVQTIKNDSQKSLILSH